MAETIGRVGWRNYVSPLPNPLWNGMLAYYTADNTANDSKGTANGVLTNGATYGTGKINGGFSFDGIDDTVTLSNTVTKFSSSTPFTYNVWVKAVSRTGFIYMDANASAAGTSIGFNGGALAFTIGDVAQWFGTSVVIPLNTWTMVTVTYNGIVNQSNNLLFYTNGTFAEGLKMNVSFNLSTASSNKQIGSGGWRGFFNGNLDELGIWGRALTASEVTELYNGGAGKQYIAPSYTARTTAFAAATGITDTTILNALNTFDTGLISNGLDTKMKALYPFVGGTANTHKFNFMDARDTDAAYRLAFNGGWVHSSTGAKPNGTNAYANTYFNPSQSLTSISNSHVSIYSRSQIRGGVDAAMNIVINNLINNEFTLSADLNISGIYAVSNISGANSGAAINYTANLATGHFIANRESNSSNKIIRNGTILASNTNSITGVLPTSNLFLAAQNYFNNSNYQVLYYTAREQAFTTIGESLTNAQSTTFYNLVQALQTSLGRAV